MASVPQTYTISDFIEWHQKNQLVLAPDFQRGSVWSTSAKVFLIDTILSDLPVPQVYLRTKIDAKAQTTIREVVDGQQRLRAIVEFATGKMRLTSKAPAYKGMRYEDLPDAAQEAFLSYRLPVVQLLNATDANVLEIFARLNSYSVKVTPAELRHAEYSEPVKWAIYDATREWAILWSELGIVSVRDSVRLKNTSIMAEFFMALDDGFGDGGETNINKYYRSHRSSSEDYFTTFRHRIDEVLRYILENTGEDFRDTTFYDAPNFLALFAAVSYLHGYLPDSRTTEGIETYRDAGVDWDKARETLAHIALAVEGDTAEAGDQSEYSNFVAATKSTTHRISSRKPRLQAIVKAIASNGVE